MKKTRLIITLSLILMTVCCGTKPVKSNTESVPTKNIEFLNSLTKIEAYEIEGMKINTQTTLIYTEDGNRPTQIEIFKMTRSGDYVVEPYRNKNGEIIFLFQRMTEEMKSMREIRDSLKNIKANLVGLDAIPFSVKDIDGVDYSLEKLRGKVVVMNFWFIACGSCIFEMPELNKLVDEYRDTNVIFLGFANDEKEKIVHFLTKKTFTYHIIPESQELSLKYLVGAFPTHVVIGKDSKIQYYHTGALESTTIQDMKDQINISLSK